MTVTVQSVIEKIKATCMENSKDYLIFESFVAGKCTVSLYERDDICSMVLSKYDAKILALELLKWAGDDAA